MELRPDKAVAQEAAVETKNATTSEQSKQSPLNGLVAVVVTYNRLEHLRLTVTRLLDSAPSVLSKIVVVDNASQDGTAQWLRAHDDPRISPVLMDENIGGAGGFEVGMRHAIEREMAQWVVVMDDDARPALGALGTFTKHGARADVIAATVFYPDGSICEMNRPTLNPFRRPHVFLKTILGAGPSAYHVPDTAYTDTKIHEIDQTSFVGLFVPRRAIEQIGYPDPSLFIYGDDVLYTMALRDAGFTIALDPKIRFEHDCSTFDTGEKPRFSPLWKSYYAYRNRLFMYRKAAGPILFWPLLSLVVLKWALAVRRYAPAQKAYSRILRTAVFDAVRRNTRRSFAEVKRLSSDP